MISHRACTEKMIELTLISSAPSLAESLENMMSEKVMGCGGSTRGGWVTTGSGSSSITSRLSFGGTVCGGTVSKLATGGETRKSSGVERLEVPPWIWLNSSSSGIVRRRKEAKVTARLNGDVFRSLWSAIRSRHGDSGGSGRESG